ncbi:hypothetical protein CP02DC14_0732B, partial [Chlamydia psittaci 02DC14]
HLRKVFVTWSLNP